MKKNLFGALFVLLFSGALATGQTMQAFSVDEFFPAISPQMLVDTIVEDDIVVSGSVTTDINTSSGFVPSDFRSMGIFVNGKVAAGTPLPPENQNPSGPTATYAGGIGIENGVCLTTGYVSDSQFPSAPGFGVGIEGPNNGTGNGEVSVSFNELANDIDLYNNVFGFNVGGGDACVLQFDVQLDQPGFLRMSYVFGSDEYPQYIDSEFNDALAILIRQNGLPQPEFQNIAVFNDPNSLAPKPFSLQDLRDCGPLFLENQVAYPITNSAHCINNCNPTVPRYDHEFGGFSKRITNESGILAPGSYTVKIVVQDVADSIIDAALFIETDSLKFYDLVNGDFNMDGVVDIADFNIWDSNQGNPGVTDASFTDGDGNGDGVVDDDDLLILSQNFQETGNANFLADFDRDNSVGGKDFTILATNFGLPSCATRALGDANDDGAVDGADFTILATEFGMPFN